ncbi:T9SS type A sorting domain-containing protein [bacterium]|nr:T9SS type A sorting domain-containing protein [bacterium]
MKTYHWLLLMDVLLAAASCLNAQTWRWTRDDLVLNPSGLDLRYASTWAWGDLDEDGVVDVIIRNGQFGGDGRLHAYRGRASSEPPYWIEAPELLTGLEEQDYALSVSLADLNGDGSLNIITRELREPVWRFLNWQRDSSGKWQADTTAFQNVVFADFELRDYDDPFFADAEGDGDLDMLINSEAPFQSVGVHYFENQGINRQPMWREDSTRLAEVYENSPGFATLSPILMHTNADTLLDLVVAFYIEAAGGLAIYPGALDEMGRIKWSGNYRDFWGYSYTGIFQLRPFSFDKGLDPGILILEYGSGHLHLKSDSPDELWEENYFRVGPLRYSSVIPFDHGYDRKFDLITMGIVPNFPSNSANIQSYQIVSFQGRNFWRNTNWAGSPWAFDMVMAFKGTLADLNQNGLPDFVLSSLPHSFLAFENSAPDFGGPWQYRNNLMAPFVRGWELPDSAYFEPSFADLDGDADPDLFITKGYFSHWTLIDAKYEFFENQLQPNTIIWKKRDDWLIGLGDSVLAHNNFVDLDNDGDADLVFGTADGTVLAYQNTGTPTSPAWQLLPEVFQGIDAGNDAAPSFGDFDNDGRPDLFVWNRAGELFFYRNESTVSVAERADEKPHSFKLYQSYPNPFNPEARIIFSVPPNARQQRVVIKIFDITGRLVRVLFDREVASGRYEVIWDGRDVHNNELASGTYVYRLETDKNVITKKMLLIH